MSKSEIFEEYAKIALEKGLIKKAEDKNKNSLDGRMSKEKISAIELLYGVKPEMPKEMKYENNLSELAHPGKKVLFNAHDKINGLIETPTEQHNIMVNLVRKKNNGSLFNEKYADLKMELIRIGNDMDNMNYPELAKLATHSLEQLQKEAAGLGGAARALGGGVSGLLGGPLKWILMAGAVFAMSGPLLKKTSVASGLTNIIEQCNVTIGSLEDLLAEQQKPEWYEFWKQLGSHTKLTEDNIVRVKETIQSIKELRDASLKVASLRPSDLSQLKTTDQAKKQHFETKAAFSKYFKQLQAAEAKINLEYEDIQHIASFGQQDSGILGSLVKTVTDTVNIMRSAVKESTDNLQILLKSIETRKIELKKIIEGSRDKLKKLSVVVKDRRRKFKQKPSFDSTTDLLDKPTKPNLYSGTPANSDQSELAVAASKDEVALALFRKLAVSIEEQSELEAKLLKAKLKNDISKIKKKF